MAVLKNLNKIWTQTVSFCNTYNPEDDNVYRLNDAFIWPIDCYGRLGRYRTVLKVIVFCLEKSTITFGKIILERFRWNEPQSRYITSSNKRNGDLSSKAFFEVIYAFQYQLYYAIMGLIITKSICNFRSYITFGMVFTLSENNVSSNTTNGNGPNVNNVNRGLLSY